MEIQKKVIFEDEKFENYKIGKIGIVKIKKDVYDIVTDLPESSNFFIALDKLENDKNISAILFLNETEALGSTAYSKYLNKTKSIRLSTEWDSSRQLNDQKRSRQIVIINRLILKLIHSNKIIIIGMTGEIVTPFLGVSLAADFRFVSENCIFLLSHADLDIHPSGGLPYFLPRYLGYSKAAHILYAVDKVTPQEALELELISKIITGGNFEEQIINEINETLIKKENLIKCTKRLMAFNFNDVEKYLSIEECDFIRF